MTTTLPKTIRVGILVFEGFEPLDVWGPVEAFSIARFPGTSYASDPPFPFETVLIANERRADSREAEAAPKPVKSVNGPRVAPDLFRDDSLGAGIDLLLIPGGLGVQRLLAPEPPEAREALLDWVRAMDARGILLTSVCTGAAILAASGVLDGKPAATNHEAFAWVARFGPKVAWDDVSRWVDAGRYVPAAGVFAGTDMGFYLVARLVGRAVAERAATEAEYDWQRDPAG
jgi:putative intracellular protease/amidase